MTTGHPPRGRGLIIGCGGTLGAAWTVAALQAVRDVLDWDPRDADLLIGTSAGAELVTMLGSGISTGDLLDMQRGTSIHPALAEHLAAAPGRFPPMPWPLPGSLGLARKWRGIASLAGLAPIGRGNASWLGLLATRLNPGQDWVPHPATWLVAADHRTGERVAFGSPTAPKATLPEALRASWAIPGWFPPVTVGTRRYIDGGAVSTASADLALAARPAEVIVLAPMASTQPAPGVGAAIERRALRGWMSAGLSKEIAALEHAGTRVIRLDATPADLRVMGPNFMDYRRRAATLEHALLSTRRQLLDTLTEGTGIS